MMIRISFFWIVGNTIPLQQVKLWRLVIKGLNLGRGFKKSLDLQISFLMDFKI